MTDEKTHIERSIRRNPAWLPAIAVLAFILLTAYLHVLLEKNAETAPVCPAEGRRLTDRELVDTFLFGPEGRTMTNAQKIARLKKEKNGVYPDCCRINKRFLLSSDIENFIWNLSGDPIYEADTMFPYISKDEKKYPYYNRNHAINACGIILKGRDREYGIPMSTQEYKSYTEMNREYWEGKRK